MRRFKLRCLTCLLGTVAVIAVMQTMDPAFSADASYWTGCYAGGQLGAALSQSDWHYNGLNPYNAVLVPPGPLLATEEPFGQTKPLVGAQIGCNFSLNNSFIAGIEGALIGKAMNRTRVDSYPPFAPFNNSLTTEISSITSLTGRLGYAVSPDWLVYARAGIAFAHVKVHGNESPDAQPFLDFKDSNWHTGWTIGGGVEYRLFRNVTLGAEYNYYHFNSKNYVGELGAPVPPVNFVNFDVAPDVHTVMGRLNFYNGPPPVAQASANRSQFDGEFSAFVNSKASYYSWTGSRGSNVFAPDRGEGHQLYVPTTAGVDYVQANALKVETRFKTGYVNARQGTPGQNAFYEGPVDSQFTVNATLLNFDSVRPQFGVAMNLPTGTSYLPNNQRFARMDPDLVEIGAYGAGFNINPTAGLVIGLNQNAALSFSLGYAWQGEFTREAVDLNNPAGNVYDAKRRIDPGDVFTANLNYTTQIGKLLVLASFAYMSESTAKVDGVDSGRAGAHYTSNVKASYNIDAQWAVTLNGSASFAEKNKIVASGSLVTEPKNSNSLVLIGSIEPSYQLTERLKIAPNYSFLWRDENYYDPFEDQFIPAKTKHTVGLSATYAMSQAASIELRGAHSWIHQDPSAYLPVAAPPPPLERTPPALSYQSWMASIAANFRF